MHISIIYLFYFLLLLQVSKLRPLTSLYLVGLEPTNSTTFGLRSNVLAAWLLGTLLVFIHYEIQYDLLCFINIFKNLGFIEIRSRVAGFRVQSANHYTIEPL